MEHVHLEYKIEFHGYDAFDQDTIMHVPIPKATDNVVPIQITQVHVAQTVPHTEWDHNFDAAEMYQGLFDEDERVQPRFQFCEARPNMSRRLEHSTYMRCGVRQCLLFQ